MASTLIDAGLERVLGVDNDGYVGYNKNQYSINIQVWIIDG